MPRCFYIQKLHVAAAFAAASLLLAVLAGCDRQPAKPQAAVPAVATETRAEPTPPNETPPSDKKQFVGSKTCYDCHTKFYEIWSTSRHGLAMQPYSAAFAKKELKPQVNDVVIGKQAFRAETGEKQGWVREKHGDKETRAIGSPMSWAARTPTISLRRCPRAVCRSCPSPTTSISRPGTTRRPAVCVTFPIAACATRPCPGPTGSSPSTPPASIAT